jgi:fumarate hydratase subunit beta
VTNDTKRITTPLTDEVVESLKAGDRVSITGVIYSARDAAHKRLVDLIAAGKELPIDIQGQIIYFMGPSPAKPGQVIGSAGPTTSYRMDAYSPVLHQHGLKGTIGKGARGPEVVEAMKKYKAVYFTATGGAGALMSKSIKKAEVVAYEDLGAEAIRCLEVEDFRCIVAQDCHGGNYYEIGVAQYRRA